MALTPVGEFLAELGPSGAGFTWAQVAELVGASSGDYVRKVAAGVKPGNNLAGNVSELRRAGTISEPAPRRVSASGDLARVRAAGAERSRVPDAVAPSGRVELYRGSSGRLGWTSSHPAPDPQTGSAGKASSRDHWTPQRAAAAQGIVSDARSIARGQGRGGARQVDVFVTVRFGDGKERENGPVRLSASDLLALFGQHDWDAFDAIEDLYDGKYGVTAGAIVSVRFAVLA